MAQITLKNTAIHYMYLLHVHFALEAKNLVNKIFYRPNNSIHIAGCYESLIFSHCRGQSLMYTMPIVPEFDWLRSVQRTI